MGRNSATERVGLYPYHLLAVRPQGRIGIIKCKFDDGLNREMIELCLKIFVEKQETLIL